MLVLECFLWQQTGSRKYLQALLDTLEEAAPDLTYGPGTRSEGVAAFFDFDNPLTDKFAHLVGAELKESAPHDDDLRHHHVLLFHVSSQL